MRPPCGSPVVSAPFPVGSDDSNRSLRSSASMRPSRARRALNLLAGFGPNAFARGSRSRSALRGSRVYLAPPRQRKSMMNNWKKAGLIGLGAVLGVLLSLNFSVIAQRDAKLPIPYEDLQLLSA